MISPADVCSVTHSGAGALFTSLATPRPARPPPLDSGRSLYTSRSSSAPGSESANRKMRWLSKPDATSSGSSRARACSPCATGSVAPPTRAVLWKKREVQEALGGFSHAERAHDAVRDEVHDLYPDDRRVQHEMAGAVEEHVGARKSPVALGRALARHAAPEFAVGDPCRSRVLGVHDHGQGLVVGAKQTPRGKAEHAHLAVRGGACEQLAVATDSDTRGESLRFRECVQVRVGLELELDSRNLCPRLPFVELPPAANTRSCRARPRR